MARTTHNRVLDIAYVKHLDIVLNVEVVPKHKHVVCPYNFRTGDEVQHSHADIVAAVMYLWDTRSITLVSMLEDTAADPPYPVDVSSF